MTETARAEPTPARGGGLLRSSAIYSALTLVSRFLGLARDLVITARLGASPVPLSALPKMEESGSTPRGTELTRPSSRLTKAFTRTEIPGFGRARTLNSYCHDPSKPRFGFP